MLSSKLLPEMEAEDNAKRDQLLSGMQNVPIPTQIEKIKVFLVHLNILLGFAIPAFFFLISGYFSSCN